MNTRHIQIGKFLSYALRHRPDKIGICIDAMGWTDIDTLLIAVASCGKSFSLEELHYVVENNTKQRFVISDDGKRIRASQGHSISVDLGYARSTPADILYHGTAVCNLSSIRVEGLLRGKRNHVHLSINPETAQKVGARHGKSALLIVLAGAMHTAGYTFFLSSNGVWLTDKVPVEYIDFSLSGDYRS